MTKRKANPVDYIDLVESSESDEDDEPWPGSRKAKPAPAKRQATARSQNVGRGAAGKSTQDAKGKMRMPLLLTQSQSSAQGAAQPSSQNTSDSQPVLSQSQQLRALLQAGPAPAAASKATGISAAAVHTPVAADNAAAPKASCGSELWVDKYQPKDEADLAVHRKKIQEVKDWLDYQLPHNRRPGSSRVLLVSGPSGCCKSITVKVLAAQLGYEVVEWTPPTPTLWSEIKYQGQNGFDVPYTSKLDEFEMFVSRAKYPSLNLTQAGGAQPAQPSSSAPPPPFHSQHPYQQQHQQHQQPAGPAVQPKLTIMDDFPHVSDPERRKRLCTALRDLVTTSRGPVVVISTETSASRGADDGRGKGSNHPGIKGLHKEVLAVFESSGTHMIGFNSITAPNISKALLSIAQKEGLSLSAPAASAVATMADGDLRHAIQTLQMMFMSSGSKESSQKDAGAKKGRGGGRKAGSSKAAKPSKVMTEEEAARIGQAQRDLGVQLFHALGKFLYNKRTEDGEEAGSAVASSSSAAQGQLPKWMPSFKDNIQLPPHRLRPPMRYDPEAILVQSGLEPLSVTSFLHENYLEFIEEGGMEDVAEAAGYLSDAGLMSCYRSPTGGYTGFWGEEQTTGSTLVAACAGSVATRGLLFANAHPAPRRFLPLKAPASSHVDAACRSNQLSLQASARTLAVLQGTSTVGGSATAVAAHVLPWLRPLAGSPLHPDIYKVLPARWLCFWKNSVVEQGMGGAARAGGRDAGELAGLMGGMDLGAKQGVEEQIEDPIEDG